MLSSKGIIRTPAWRHSKALKLKRRYLTLERSLDSFVDYLATLLKFKRCFNNCSY